MSISRILEGALSITNGLGILASFLLDASITQRVAQRVFSFIPNAQPCLEGPRQSLQEHV